jgi:peroxiredoxin
MIASGDHIPDTQVRTLGPEGPVTLNTGELFASGRTVLFGVPGAFTPGCDRTHLPGFVAQADELLAKGVDRIACIAVNDAWVMDAWGKSHSVGDKITMLADGSADFARAAGLERDLSGAGMGVRCKRFAAIIDDGVVTRIDVDETGAVDQSSCGAVLLHL